MLITRIADLTCGEVIDDVFKDGAGFVVEHNGLFVHSTVSKVNSYKARN
jgi:hypothetical protein